MAEYTKPLPVVDADTQPYWDGAKAHELRAQRCSGCGKHRWPPQSFCPHCHSWDFEWVTIGQTGVIASYVVVHQATAPSFAGDVPYTIGQITIDGTGDLVTMISNVVDCPWEEVQVGMRVQAVFDDVTPEITLPKFKPA
jgi:uncharacterized protein